MKRTLHVVMAVALVFGLGMMAGCAKKAASSSDAIQQAKTMKTPQEQANYLVSQANAFLSSKEYQEAIKTAQYILSSVDSNSQAAKSVLEKAQAKLTADAKAAAGDAKKTLGF